MVHQPETALTMGSHINNIRPQIRRPYDQDSDPTELELRLAYYTIVGHCAASNIRPVRDAAKLIAGHIDRQPTLNPPAASPATRAAPGRCSGSVEQPGTNR